MLKQKKSNTKIPVNKMSYKASISSKNLNGFFQPAKNDILADDAKVTDLQDKEE
ncbi:TPA: hypothetical protein HA246_01755 [Candidatus Woesearchaeota archaeon]|nr:hypothetical protein [Candidatus Woesearchaeota archaeon]